MIVAAGLDEAFARAYALSPDQVFVAGGGQIYAAAWDRLDRLEITEVDAEPVGDVSFPAIGPDWTETARDARHGFAFITFRETFRNSCGSTAVCAALPWRGDQAVVLPNGPRWVDLRKESVPMKEIPLSAKLGAEALGTFWLVFGGCGSAVIAAQVLSGEGDTIQLGIGFLGVALAFGLTVLTGAFAFGHVSGGHFNPAVSIGLAIAKRFEPKLLLPVHRHPVVVAATARRRRAAADRHTASPASTRWRAASPPTATVIARRAATRCWPAS